MKMTKGRIGVFVELTEEQKNKIKKISGITGKGAFVNGVRRLLELWDSTHANNTKPSEAAPAAAGAADSVAVVGEKRPAPEQCG
jgi:hypothetical protein